MAWVAVGGMALGAGAGYMESKRKQKQQERSGQAAADATAVSWARKDGKGSIPEIQWNDTSLMGNTLKGGLSGFMSGKSLQGPSTDTGIPETASGTGIAPSNSNMGFADSMGPVGQTMPQSNPMPGLQAPQMDWNSMNAQTQAPGTNWFGSPNELQAKKPNFYKG